MRRLALRPSEWPVTVKIPVLVVVLMIAVSGVITNQVLSRLTELQRRHFDELTASYLDGLSSSLVPAVLREDVWETFETLDRARSLYRGLKINETIVTNNDAMILGSDRSGRTSLLFGGRRRGESSVSRRSGSLARRGARGGGRATPADVSGSRDWSHLRGVRCRFVVQRAPLGSLDTHRHECRDHALGLAAFGYVCARQILRPVHVLTRHLHQGVASSAAPIPEHRLGSEHSEFGQLFRRYNALVQAMQERELLSGRLAEEERLASLGRLASGLAHEINNPLGGLFNAIDTLKRHGDRPTCASKSL